MQRASASADEHPSRRRGVDHPSGGSTGERTHRQGNGSIAQKMEKEKMSSCGEEANRGRHTWDWNKRHVRGCWRGTPLDVEYVVRHGEGNKSCRGLERVAQDGSVLKGAGRPQVQVQRLQSKCQARFFRACALFTGHNGSLTDNELFPLKPCQNKLARRLFALMKRNWDSEPRKQHIPTKELDRKLGVVPITMELSH